MPPSIFVSIAAYRDPELQHTLVDLFERAAHPERVEVGVAWEAMPGEDAHCLAVAPPRPAQVQLRESHAHWSRGAAAARWEASRLWQGQDYVLECDSHMRFVDGWDVRLIEMHRRLPSEKAVLSMYPPEYTPAAGEAAESRVEGWAFAIGVKAVREDGLAQLTGKAIALGEGGDEGPANPLPGAFVTPRCLFGPGEMLDDVPPDPFLFHFGEDIDRSVRLWTHGYDIYHPHRRVAWHRWSRAGRVTHFADHPDWRVRDALSVMRLRHKLGVAAATDDAALEEMAAYGTGEVRSLADHAHYSGYDPAAGTADGRARDGRRYALPPSTAARVAASGVAWVTGGDAPGGSEPRAHAPRLTHASDDFVVIDDFLPPDVFDALRDHCLQMDYKHINTSGKVSRVWRVRDGFPLRGIPDVMRVVGGEGKTSHTLYPTGSPIDGLSEAIEAAAGEPQVSALVGGWDRFSLTSWLYPRGTGLSLHHDGTAGYTGAYAFFLTPEWDLHWGGLLLVFEGAANAGIGRSRAERLRKWMDGAAERAALLDPGMARCVLPVANRIVFLHPEAHHAVTAINTSAGDRARLSVAGFFSRKG